MENFTTTVELQNPDDGDYDLLQQEMHEALFCRAVKHNGVWHNLLEYEYDCSSDLTTIFIYNLAYKAAQAVIEQKPINDNQQAKDFWIIVTKADGDRVFRLPKTTDIMRLPPGETL